MTKNEEIIIKEYFKADDSHSKVRGFVFAYDEDNNLVFAKENMIVKTGRRFIMNNGIQDNCFSAAFLSENMNMVSEDDVEFTSFRAENSTNYRVPGLDRSNFESWDASYKKTEDTERDTNKTYYILNENGSFESSPGTTFTQGTVYYEDRNLEDKNYFSYFIDYDNLIVNCLIVFNDSNPIKASSLGLIAKYDAPAYFKTNDSEKQNGKKYFTKKEDVYEEFSGDNFATGVNYYECNENGEVLFSRLTFPKYYKSSQQRLTFRYYIYF